MQTPLTPLERDLSGLLIFVAKVAVAIRRCSAYGDTLPSERSTTDVMWLSDCLHNLDRLGQALKSGMPPIILTTCDGILRQLVVYTSTDQTQFKSAPRPSFERNLEHFELGELELLINAIRARAQAAVQP